MGSGRNDPDGSGFGSVFHLQLVVILGWGGLGSWNSCHHYSDDQPWLLQMEVQGLAS